MPNSVTSSTQQPGWFDRNSKTIGTIGLVIAALSIGYMIAGFSSLTDPSLPGTFSHQDRVSICNAMISQTVSSVGIAPLVFGLIAAGCTYYVSTKKQKNAEVVTFEEAQIKSNAKKWKMVATMVGLFIGMIGLGMLITSALLLRYQIPAMKDLVNSHPNDYAWQALNESWVNATQLKLGLLLTGGIVTAAAGGGLIVAGVGTATIKEKWKLWKAKLLSTEVQKAEDEKL